VALKRVGDIELPAHRGEGGFDHAAVHCGRGLLYVAHTANDAVDVIDTRAGRYVRSITGLKGVAGALVGKGQDLVFTSNRGENTVGIFAPQSEDAVDKVAAGIRPNGLAYDPDRGVLLCANVGDPNVTHSPSVTLIDVATRSVLGTIPMPGRTRWAIFDPEQHLFFVNIADPPVIVVVDPETGGSIERRIDVPARGPHGLEIDPSGRRLLCACDEGKLVSISARSGEVLGILDLSGPPDVVFLSQSLAHLYVAAGDPGVIDVIDIGAWRTVEAVPTGLGAHTIAHDHDSNRVYAFLPQTHRATVFQDGDQ
jgi:DNA-binding beta-propeller fold protein YncE